MQNILLITIYAIPILRLGLFFVPPINSRRVRHLNAIIGRIEWFIRPLRDSIVLAILLFLIARGIYLNSPMQTLYYAVFVLVSIFATIRHKLHARQMAEFGRKNPFIHPCLFFTCLYAGLGIIPTRLPSLITNTVDPSNCSFKRGGTQSKKLLPAIVGVFNTLTLSKLILAAYKWRGPAYSREVAENISIIWGTRVAYLGRFSVKTEGLEKLSGLNGKFIFALTHKSFLDFAFGTLGISKIHPTDRPSFSFRHLAARDHFIDNPFLHHIMGRSMQLIGTIFVDRKRREESPRVAANEASEKLVSLDIDIVLFPQGTRALGNTDRDGKRLDSGYYTSGTKERLIKSGGHLKKGAAFIAVDTATTLKDREKSIVHIIPVGIIGTGLAAPKNKWTILTETEIKIKIGNPISIAGNNVKTISNDLAGYKAFVETIHNQIDEKLIGLLDIHSRLEQRFFRDIRGLLPAPDYEHVSVAMKAWRGKDYLIYTLLDCIYATRPVNWQAFLRELSYLMINDAPVASLLHFKERIIDFMLEGK